MDILTLAIIQSLASGMQVAALYGQYRMDKTHSGSDWWTAGSACFAMGFAFNLLRNIPFLGTTAVIANCGLIFTGLAFFMSVSSVSLAGRNGVDGWFRSVCFLFC